MKTTIGRILALTLAFTLCLGTVGLVTASASEVKPTLQFLMPNVSIDPATYYPALTEQALTGYKIEYEMLPAENSLDALNMKIATGTEYDLIHVGGNYANRAALENFAKQGALVELDDLLAEYGPNILAAVSERAWEMTKVDGKTYVIPNLDPAVNPKGNMFDQIVLRQDWMDALNLATPTTTAELRDVLQAFKDNDPGSQGEQNIPFVLASTPNIGCIMGSFGIYHSWNAVDGKMVADICDPRYYDYLKYMAGLYADGLIDPEFPINKGTTKTEKFTSGRAGATIHPVYDLGPITDALANVVPESVLDVILCMTNADGVRLMGASSGLNYVAAIPTSCKNPVEVIKFLNIKLQPDNFRQTVIGEEGVHYTVEDGSYIPIQPKFFDELNFGNNFITGADDAMYGIYWGARVKKDMRNWDAYVKTTLSEPNPAVTNPIDSASLLPEFVKNQAALEAMVADYAIKIIAGAEDLDSSIDAFIAKWRAEGGDIVEQEINEWYATFAQ